MAKASFLPFAVTSCLISKIIQFKPHVIRLWQAIRRIKKEKFNFDLKQSGLDLVLFHKEVCSREKVQSMLGDKNLMSHVWFWERQRGEGLGSAGNKLFESLC